MHPGLLAICVAITVFGLLCLAIPGPLIRWGRGIPVPGRTISGPPTKSQMVILRSCGAVMVVVAVCLVVLL